jgi:hypothetical protein
VDLHHKFTGSLNLFFAGNKTFAQATRLEAVLLLDCSAGNDTFPVLLNYDSGTFNFIRIGLLKLSSGFGLLLSVVKFLAFFILCLSCTTVSHFNLFVQII